MKALQTPAKREAAQHDAHAAQRHGHGRPDGAQPDPSGGVEQARDEGEADDVEDEGLAEVEALAVVHLTRDAEQGWQCGE